MNLIPAFKRIGWTIEWLAGLGLVSFLIWVLIPYRPALSQNIAQTAKPAPDLAAGKEAYEQNCARCHGLKGAGDGPDAKLTEPKPRKLSEGIFKFRTTASGTPPTDEDLFRTLSTGLPGSRMPEFQRLPEETRWQLVYYVKSLTTVFEQQKPEPIDFGKDPGSKEANLAKGKEVYAQLGCAACHGNFGRADGPSAPTLVDNWGQPIRPADLTQGWNYRGGSAPRDILIRMMTGIDGTPMPSYAEAVSSKEDVWNLAYYVHSLQEPPRWSRTIEAVKAPETLPTTPKDPLWQKVPRTDLSLSSTFYHQGKIEPTTTTAISIQAVYNENAILFRLAWHDPVENRTAPPDALGLFLVPERRSKLQVGSLRSWPAAADSPALDLCYWSAEQNTGREAVQQDIARMESGQEPGTPLPYAGSIYEDGQWMVLLKRSLKGQPPGSVSLAPQKPVVIGVAVWNGANQEQGRRRANSNWVDLVLK